MSNDYVSNVLIKLKREYKKDEILQAVIKENSDLLVENGQLKSEIEHLQHQLKLKERENQEIELQVVL
jgi:predicted nuclease with TOPRIM domain